MTYKGESTWPPAHSRHTEQLFVGTSGTISMDDLVGAVDADLREVELDDNDE